MVNIPKIINIGKQGVETLIQKGSDLYDDLGGSTKVDNITQEALTKRNRRRAAVSEARQRQRAPGAGRKVGYRKPVMDSKQMSLEFLLNQGDPKLRQESISFLEALRKGNMSDTEAAQGISALFPDKSSFYQPKIDKTTTKFTKLKADYEDFRRRDPKFEEDIYDIYIEAPNQPKPATRNMALNVLEEAEKDVSMEPFVVKFANAYSKIKGQAYKKMPRNYEEVRRIAKAILEFQNKNSDILYKGPDGQIFVGEDGVRTFVNREGISAKKSFEKDFKVGDIVKGEAAKHLRNIADSTGKPFSMVSREISRQNPYVADRILEMRKFFNEDLGQAHFYGLDHVKAPRFGGTNAIENLHFTMEGPHNALKPLDPTKTLSDIDVKNKSKMEADVHKLALQLVDNVSSGNIDKATELSEQIKQITDSFANTYSKTDFHIGEPYVPVKTGDNNAEFIKYTDYLKLTPKLKKIVTDLLPDQFNKPNVGISIEDQVDQVYNVYAEMFNLGGPISKEQMTQMGFYNKGGAVDAATVRPEITLEFGGEEEGGGAFDYIKDKAASIDEGLQTYIDEELGGKSYRAAPVAIGEMLQAPGNIADSIRAKMEETNKHIDKAQDMLELERLEAVGSNNKEKHEQIKRQQELLDSSRVTDFDKYVNLATAPLDIFDIFFGEDLGKAYKNMFTDEDDTTLYLDPTGLFSDKSYTIEGDSTFGKVIGAARTLGLTAAEIALLFTPYQLLKLRKLNSSKIKKILVGAVNLGVPAAGFAYGYSSLPKNFDEAREGLKQSEEGATRSVEEIQKEVTKGDQADPLNPGGPGLDYADGGLIGLPPEFTGEYAETKLAMGGDPGQFTNPTPSGLEEEIDIGDYLLDSPYESVEDLDNLFDITRSAEDSFQRGTGGVDDFPEVQMASLGKVGEGIKYVLGEVPNWVRQGKERVQKILPKTGDDLEQSLITTLDEGTVTRTQPGQLFYSRLEAELMQGPKVYESLDAFKKYTQSRNIGKVELFDSELERIIESAQAAGRPITRELVLGALKESPLSKVQSKGYGFLSNSLDGKQRELKYPGYKEGGALPGTDRERLLFVDPNDLRGDPGSLPSTVSPHSWEEPYTIAWSRLSDRDLGGQYAGKTVTFADEIQSDIFQSAQKTAGKLAAKIKYMADNNVPLDTINNELQRDMMTFFADKGSVYRESLPGAAELQVEMKALMDLQDQLTALKNTPVPEITDDMLDAAKNIRFQQNDIIDNMTEELNLQLVKTLYPNLPFKLRGQWADASIKRDVYEAAYRKFVLKDPDATDYYAVTPANLVTKRYSHEGSSATSRGDRAKDKAERIKRWVDGGMEGDLAPSRYPGVGMYEFYGGPGADVVTDTGKHYTSEIEKILKRIANENQVPLETLPVRISEGKREVFQVVDRNTGEVLGSGNTGRQADAIANDIIANSDRKVVVQRAEEFDTAPSFGIELTPSMAEAFKAYMAKGGLVEEEILLPYGD